MGNVAAAIAVAVCAYDSAVYADTVPIGSTSFHYPKKITANNLHFQKNKTLVFVKSILNFPEYK